MKRTINKVLEELKKEGPDLSYIRGLLEGLVEEETTWIPPMRGGSTSVPHIPPHSVNAVNLKQFEKSDEQEIIPEFAKPGPVGQLTS